MAAPIPVTGSLGPMKLQALRAAYARFLAPGRILLTGHSHQAWPDVARDAQAKAFDDAAELADDKWSAVVEPKITTVGRAILDRMGFDKGDAIAFGKSTHELVYRLLTCLPPMHDRPRIVTTNVEFHSLRRQLSRVAEEGAEVIWVDAQPREALADRLLAALTPGTALLALSAVLFEDAFIVPRFGEILERAKSVGAIPLVDAYHAFNVVPIEWGPAKESLFVTSGGYKYAGFGEGVCWLRIPKNCELRPVYTGWFSEFGALSDARVGTVSYGPAGARFTGATFDPTPIYRAEAVLAHWDRHQLTLERLRAISVRQTRRILARIAAAGQEARIASAEDDARRGGFVAVRARDAADIVNRLRAKKVLVDARGTLVRLGPAPYLTDDEIDKGTDALLEELRQSPAL